jgi:hypothetical protein
MTTLFVIVAVVWLGVRMVRLLRQLWRVVSAEISSRIGVVAPA